MKRLKAKLHSERGASILLALLMFLVCVMVAASVLAAAASNAGKVRSNRAEQQKFLNLSSAIQLVADEIQRAEYRGSYVVYEWTEVITTTITVTNPDGTKSETSTSKSTDYFWCEQKATQPGYEVNPTQFTCGDLTKQLPLEKELDEIFSKQFTGAGYKALTITEPDDEYYLLVKLEGTFPSDSAPKGYEVPKEVTVRVKLDGNTHHILLTAWEGAEDNPSDMNKTMQAELVAKIEDASGKLQDGSLAIDYNPAGRMAGAGKQDSGVDLSLNQTRSIIKESEKVKPDNTKPAMKWELNWVRKGEAAP